MITPNSLRYPTPDPAAALAEQITATPAELRELARCMERDPDMLRTLLPKLGRDSAGIRYQPHLRPTDHQWTTIIIALRLAAALVAAPPNCLDLAPAFAGAFQKLRRRTRPPRARVLGRFWRHDHYRWRRDFLHNRHRRRQIARIGNKCRASILHVLVHASPRCPGLACDVRDCEALADCLRESVDAGAARGACGSVGAGNDW
jgi:hypothetical protein